MKIKSFMITDPITTTEDASIEEAIELMKNNSIRHLPVVSEGKMLKGFVTLADLRTGLIPSMLAGLTLADLMIRDPITVDPESDIELAAQLIYKYKIGGMPVVKKGRLVGIITESDLLRAFIDMMGILSASSRIDVVVGMQPGSFNRAAQIVQDFGGEIIRTEPVHGKTSQIFHNGEDIFQGIKNPLFAARYHSLLCDKETVPDCMKIIARTEDGMIMGIKHLENPIVGLQFHPESVGTDQGMILLKNFMEMEV